MAYYKKVLQPDERVKYVGTLHWIIYKNAIVFGVLAACAAFIYTVQPGDRSPAVSVVALVLTSLAVLFYLRSWFIRTTTEIVVTDKRIIHKIGWIARHTEEMNITKVETVDVNQGIAGRIFGFGAVLIKGIGGSWEPLRHIALPLELRNAIIVG